MKMRLSRRQALIWGTLTTTCLVTMIVAVYADGAMPPLALAVSERAVDPEGPATPAPPPAAFRMPPLASFAEVNGRPLFAADRRPHKTTVRASAPAAPIVLSGIVIMREGRYAMIREGSSPVARRVLEGQTIDSGTVKRIMPDHIEITVGSDADAVVKLFAPNATKPGADRVPPPAESRPEPRTQRPIAQSGSPLPDANSINNAPRPSETPARSGPKPG